jgi:hypothetical protein
MRTRTRSAWPILAGVLLLLDGIGALLLGAALLVLSVIPRAGAVEGRAPVDQTAFGPALGLLVFAIACGWAAVSAFRGRRSMRLVGIALAAVLVVLFTSLPFTYVPADSGEIVFLVAIGAIQAVIILALVRWPAGGDERPSSAATAT